MTCARREASLWGRPGWPPGSPSRLCACSHACTTRTTALSPRRPDEAKGGKDAHCSAQGPPQERSLSDLPALAVTGGLARLLPGGHAPELHLDRQSGTLPREDEGEPAQPQGTGCRGQAKLQSSTQCSETQKDQRRREPIRAHVGSTGGDVLKTASRLTEMLLPCTHPRPSWEAALPLGCVVALLCPSSPEITAM